MRASPSTFVFPCTLFLLQQYRNRRSTCFELRAAKLSEKLSQKRPPCRTRVPLYSRRSASSERSSESADVAALTDRGTPCAGRSSSSPSAPCPPQKEKRSATDTCAHTQEDYTLAATAPSERGDSRRHSTPSINMHTRNAQPGRRVYCLLVARGTRKEQIRRRRGRAHGSQCA